jgi:hypothetical protein
LLGSLDAALEFGWAVIAEVNALCFFVWEIWA